MSEVIFDYEEDCCRSIVQVNVRLMKNIVHRFSITIFQYYPCIFCNDLEIDDWDVWNAEIYEKCKKRFIPSYYHEIGDGMDKNGDPIMTKNTKKYEFCSIMNGNDDHSCCQDECPKWI